MTARPLVSVILPTHDRLDTLPSAVDSVLRQRLDCLELIVVDDASQDGTLDWLQTVPDPRLKVLALPANLGAADARNAGIAAASGDFIGFIDSDGEWVPDELTKQVVDLQGVGGPDAPVVHVCSFVVSTPAGRLLGGPLLGGSAGLRKIFSARSGEWVTSTFLATRAALAGGVHYSARLAALEDQDWLAQVLRGGGAVLASRSPLVRKGGKRDDALSSHWNLAHGHGQFVDRHCDHRSWGRRFTVEHYLDAAYSYELSGDPVAAARALAHCIPRSGSLRSSRSSAIAGLRLSSRLSHPRYLYADTMRRVAGGAR